MHLFMLFSLKCCRIVIYIFAMCLCPCLDDFLDSERGFLAQLHLLPQWKSSKSSGNTCSMKNMAAYKRPDVTALADSWITHNSLQYRCDIGELIMNVKQLLYDNVTWVVWARNNIQPQHDTEIRDQNTFYHRRLQARQWLVFPSQSHTLTHLMWWHWTRHWTYDWSPWGFSPQVQRVEIWIPSTQTCFGLCASSEPPGRFWFTHLQQTHPAG